ncbi:hypothetical protein [Chryseobacterium sp. StRB126]|uniref:hypothetical protein n=1 Tax=Chryseobacterium sp. StRB126 TaxID=878220 RepID=UPI000A45C869|nr:hypothetical protein [Chryseobacterium sp. StRB126]
MKLLKKINITMAVLISAVCSTLGAQVLMSNDPIRMNSNPSTNFGLEIDPKTGALPLKITNFPFKNEPTPGSRPLIIDAEGKVKKLNIAKATISDVLFKKWNVTDYNDLQAGVYTILPPFGGKPNAAYNAITTNLTGCMHSGSKTIPLVASGSAVTNCSDLPNGNTKMSGYATVPNTDFNLRVNFNQKVFIHAFIFGHVIPTYLNGTLSVATPNYGYTTAAALNSNYNREWLNSGSLTADWENHGGTLSYSGKKDRLYQNGSDVDGYDQGGAMVFYEVIYSTDSGSTWSHSGITCNNRYIKGVPLRITLAGGVDIPANTDVQFKIVSHYRFPFYAQQTTNAAASGELNDSFKFLINSINILAESKRQIDL